MLISRVNIVRLKKNSFLKAFLMQGKNHMEEQLFDFKKVDVYLQLSISLQFTILNE